MHVKLKCAVNVMKSFVLGYLIIYVFSIFLRTLTFKDSRFEFVCPSFCTL